MATIWRVAVDWDGDGNFTGTYDDITTDVILVKWRNGMRKPFQEVADESVCTLRVLNTDGKYTPENSGSVIYGKLLPNRKVQISAVRAGVETVQYTGWTDKFAFEVVAGGLPEVGISCVGPKKFLQEIVPEQDIYEDVTGDEIIDDYLTQGGVTADTVETGITEFGWFGDIAVSNLFSGLTQITVAERGKFFFNKDGEAVWWNRHHQALIDDEPVIVSAESYAPVRINYVYGEDVANVVRVTAQPRSVAGSPSTLWSLEAPVSVPPGGTVEFEASYRNSKGQFAGGGSVSYSGATFSTGAAIIVVTSRGSYASVTLTNAGSNEAILTALNITGNEVNAENELIVEAVDTDSVTAYGQREQYKLNLPPLSNYNEAEGIAWFEIGRRSTPRGEIRSVVYESGSENGANDHQLDWDIGTLVRVIVDDLYHDEQYMIIGYDHEVSMAEGSRHVTTFYLERRDAGIYWILEEVGASELDSTTVLMY